MRFQERVDNWDFDANSLPLDFANTAEWHAAPEPTERLNTYDDLVAWSWAAGLLTDREALRLEEEGSKRPGEAARTLARAIDIRESIYQIFSALAADRHPPEQALIMINDALPAALSRARIISLPQGFEWGWIASPGDLDRMLWPILRSAADLLASDDLDRVGECADDHGCGYLFFDTSRNQSRRWCSMESCGNRAKARRHYRRSKS
jgi:predicted RNA-binding Zn ribbon-like protein